jgi:hypothetical protein
MTLGDEHQGHRESVSHYGYGNYVFAAGAHWLMITTIYDPSDDSVKIDCVKWLDGHPLPPSLIAPSPGPTA